MIMLFCSNCIKYFSTFLMDFYIRYEKFKNFKFNKKFCKYVASLLKIF